MDQDQDDRAASAASTTKATERAGTSSRPSANGAAVDVEMPERVHEVFEEERRAGHEHEQRQVVFAVEAEGAPKQHDEQAKRDQPDTAGEREHQPYRHLCEEQRDDGADQRALGEAEMIVDQKVNVGDEGRQRELVRKTPITTATLTASIRRQGFSAAK